MKQYFRMKKMLAKTYPTYTADFLLKLVESENGFLYTFPQNLAKILMKLEKERTKNEPAALRAFVRAAGKRDG